MVRAKTIIISVLVAIIGIWAAVHIFPSEKMKVRKQLDLLSKYVSKGPGETALKMALKTQSIRTLLAEHFELKADVISLSGSYTPQEITSYVASARLRFSRLSLRLYDVHIDFPEEGTAKVILTAKLTGNWRNGDYLDEIHELQCLLKKIEGKWLFSECEVVEVLKK